MMTSACFEPSGDGRAEGRHLRGQNEVAEHLRLDAGRILRADPMRGKKKCRKSPNIQTLAKILAGV